MRFHWRGPPGKVPASRPAKERQDDSSSTGGSGWRETQQALGNQGAQRFLRSAGAQGSVRIGAPNDRHEQEAERLAESALTRNVKADAGGAPAPPTATAAAPGTPLPPALRQDMEQRFEHDFSGVRMHSGGAAEQSARKLDAHAYTVGQHIVFGAGAFAPQTGTGRRLIAHELAHVVQQSRAAARGKDGTPLLQRYARIVPLAPLAQLEAAAEAFVAPFHLGIVWDVNGVAKALSAYVKANESPYTFVRAVFAAIPSEYEDDIGRVFVQLLPDSTLDEASASSEGRAMLDVLYAAMITGDVSSFEEVQQAREHMRRTFGVKVPYKGDPAAFERQQAERVLMARARRVPMKTYLKHAMKKYTTRVFPVQFMRAFSTADYAPPEARLLANGLVWVKYPAAVQNMNTYAAEVRTLPGGVFGQGREFPPDEIVGIKLYEQGGAVIYRPAIALIDYANQATQSTIGKIATVSLLAGTLGLGLPAGGGLALADRVAWIIGASNFLVQQHRDWILENFGSAGKVFVETLEFANSIAEVYGMGRLAAGGYDFVKKLRDDWKACRPSPAQLDELDATAQELVKKIDAEMDTLAQLEAKAAPAPEPAAAPAPPPAAPAASPPAVPATKPMKRPAGGGRRGGVTATARTVRPLKPSTPEVTVLPRSSKPLKSEYTAEPVAAPARSPSPGKPGGKPASSGRDTVPAAQLRQQLRKKLQERVKDVEARIEEFTAASGAIEREIKSLTERMKAASSRGDTAEVSALRSQRQELIDKRVEELGSGKDLGSELREAKRLLRGTEKDYFEALSSAASKRPEYHAVRERNVDEVFGTQGQPLEVEHIYPRSKIFSTPGFERLQWEQQIRVFNYQPNLTVMSAEANAARGTIPYASWRRGSWPLRSQGEMAELERRMQEAIEKMIANPQLIP